MFDPLHWSSLPHIEYTLYACCYRNFQDSERHGVSGSPWIPALPHERDWGYHQGRLPPTCVQTLISLHSPYLVLVVYTCTWVFEILCSSHQSWEEWKRLRWSERSESSILRLFFLSLSYLFSLPYPLSFLSLSPSYYYPPLPHLLSFLYLSPLFPPISLSSLSVSFLLTLKPGWQC